MQTFNQSARFTSYHIYVAPHLQDEWIFKHLVIQRRSLFFVRYADRFEDAARFREDNSDCHLRLRFHGEILPKFVRSTHNVVKVEYHPEVQRYGGPSRLCFAEEYFCLSSRFVINQISETYLRGRFDSDLWKRKRTSVALKTIRPLLVMAEMNNILPEVLRRAQSFHSHAFRAVDRPDSGERIDRARIAFCEILDESKFSNSTEIEYLRHSRHCLAQLVDVSILCSLLHMNMNRLGFLPIEEFGFFQILNRNIDLIRANLQ